MTGLEAVRAMFSKVDAECGGYHPTRDKKKYFYNDDNGDAIIIDEKTLEEAERGENYLGGVHTWWDLGEFETPEQARQKYDDLQADHRYCVSHDC